MVREHLAFSVVETECAYVRVAVLAAVAAAGKRKEHKLPIRKVKGPFNYGNSAALCYEAEEVHRCLAAGLLESPVLPLVSVSLLSCVQRC